MAVVARVVLHTYGTADPNNVAFFTDFDFPRKVVSVLFCNGENLGQNDSLRNGFLL